MNENIAVANINKAVNGIELAFDRKPPREVLRDLRENGFRWHNKKQIWYGRNTAANVRAVEKYVDLDASDLGFGITPDGTVDVRALRAERMGVPEVKSDEALSEPTQAQSATEMSTSEKPAGEKPCIADFYKTIGRGEVFQDSTVEGALWSPVVSHSYYKDINACIWCNREAAYVVELDNALRRGKECNSYSVYARGADIYLYLANECGVRTPKDLYELVRSGKELPGNGVLNVRQEKGVEVFSPFIPVEPLKKLPEKWKKADLAKAIMAGQVFSGVLDQRLTDDYALDAAYGFGAGRKLNLPGEAFDLVEGCRDCYISTNSVDENGVASVHFSYGGESKTFLFDVNCNLAESVARQEAAERQLAEDNQKIRDSVKQFKETDIDPSTVYLVDRVDEDSNSGRLRIRTEVVQGFVLAGRLDFGEITDLRRAELEPDKLYEVANTFNRREYAEADPRIVDLGNWKQVCSGRALEELTREGVRLYLTAAGCQHPRSFASVKEECAQLASGKTFYTFSNKVDYGASLQKLMDEEARVSSGGERSIGDSGVEEQSVRADGAQPVKAAGTEKREFSSLMDIIGFAEAKKEFEKNQRGARPAFARDDGRGGL